MPTFDGDNLIITLDSGVTDVNVIDNLYEPWKDWMLASTLNRKYPQAFVSDGGANVTTTLKQGAYIFLQNTSGWRLRPPEEDITIYFTGNLAVASTALPAFVPTIGGYTAAILGIQPITQIAVTGSGVTEQDKIDIAGKVRDIAIDNSGNVSLQKAVFAILSALAGVADGGGTTEIKFRNQGDTADALVMTVDENGNRTSVIIGTP